MDKMCLYVWSERHLPDECKMGERWVKSGQREEDDVRRRIKDSVGVRKDLIRDGTIQLDRWWDVSDLARRIGRFYPHAKVDDWIRQRIGFRKNSTGEVHTISAAEMIRRVDQLLIKWDQPLPVATLSAWQARMAEQVLQEIATGKRTISAELCARFGKTIWAGSLIRETQAQLTVIVSYVLTSFSSFENQFSGFDQFRDLVIIDSADAEYQQVVDAALDQGKQVVVFLSMCAGERRQSRIDYLFSRSVNRLIIVDEADFGVHRSGQARPLIQARGRDDVLVLMTGTNADKAASYWPVDSHVSVVYPELLMEKRQPKKTYSTSLRHFDIDPARHELVVDVEFYQMDLKSAVEWAARHDPDCFQDDGVYLPSWSKFAANPVKAKGFWTRMLQAVFLGQHGWDELNVDYQTGRRSREGQRVAMMFLSGATRNDMLEEAVGLAKQALPNMQIVPVYGEEMTNRSAEQDVHEAIDKAAKKGQDVLIVSAGMAQRSFSVGAITELYLAYDTGDQGATIQKISRALTPDRAGKVGRIVSLSFDPNRDDKFDALLIETAMNYKRSHGLRSAKDALRDVIRTVDIFRCTQDGSIKMQADQYLEQAIARRSVSRVVGKVAKVELLTTQELAALAAGNAEAFRAAKQESTRSGRTRLSASDDAVGKNAHDPELARARVIARAREVITTIVENMDIIVHGTGTQVMADAFDLIHEDADKRLAVEQEFGLDFDIIRELFERGIINQDLIQLQVDH